MAIASLIHRGEHFRYEEDGERFEGECVWAWTDGDPPQRTYPITIDVRSIALCGPSRHRRPSAARQREIAREVKRLLELQDPTCEVRLAPADAD
jgi:hypothetical protein